MDEVDGAIVGLLDGVRARGAFLLRTVMDPPWSMRIEDEAPLTLVAAVRGEAWIAPDRAVPVRLVPGDVAIVRGPDHYIVADAPATLPTVLIHPGHFPGHANIRCRCGNSCGWKSID